MQRIGLTGNIGSGKTTICRVFEAIGVPVFYADVNAREQLLQPDVVGQIVALFGDRILDDKKHIDRKALAAIVFNDKEALKKLNAVIHPLVRAGYETWVAQQQHAYTIHEAAVLFESGMAHRFDKTILVTAPLEVRIDRVCKRDQVSREQVMARVNNQMSEEELLKKVDYEIVNNGNVLVIPQILSIDEALRH